MLPAVHPPAHSYTLIHTHTHMQALPGSFENLTKLHRLVLRSGGVVSMSGQQSDTGNLLIQAQGYYAEAIRKTCDGRVTKEPEDYRVSELLVKIITTDLPPPLPPFPPLQLKFKVTSIPITITRVDPGRARGR